MKNHVWHPVLAAIGLIVAALAVRFFLVPADFGVQEKGYMYGFHRQGNEEDWRQMPVRYRSSAGCGECHRQADLLQASPHAPISCENCHGPALEHPFSPPLLAVDNDRGLCLRCHAGYAYQAAGRSRLPAVAESHFPAQACSACHNPHRPDEVGP